MNPVISHVSPAQIQAPAERDGELMKAARELEASFLAEMLKSAGFGKSRESFGGGAGEDQFQSFLVREHARALVENGGIGLAQSLFEVLKTRDGEGLR